MGVVAAKELSERSIGTSDGPASEAVSWGPILDAASGPGRGVLAPGSYADVNVLDLDGMRLAMPAYVHDCPGGAGCLIQKAEGYDYTIVNGQVFMESGEHTGALGGSLLRSGPDQR